MDRIKIYGLDNMVASKIITLLTDFGESDAYVGVMKGMIAQITSQLDIIDLTHQIPPQNLLAAKYVLFNAYPYFPSGTIHIVVVDPGVGSTRRGVAIELSNGYVVCPDNGICSGVLDSAIAAVELTNPQYWRVPNPSNTFHGRDIFAPVGAHLANGVPLAKLGQKVELESLVRLDLPAIVINQPSIVGCVQYIDRFGNLITNIPERLVNQKSWQIIDLPRVIHSATAYSDVASGEAVTLVGSHGWVEIAINSGSAAAELNLTWQDKIHLLVNV